MALQYLAGLVITGLSSDTKPTTLDPEAWRFIEKDTGKSYQWTGADWIVISEENESKQLFAQKPKSSFIQLFGDEFAQVQADALYLLEDLTDEQGGASLTNNGSIDLTRVEDKLPLRGHLVPTFDGSTQYFTSDNTAFDVGTNSFIVKCDFKTTDQSSNNALFGYGDLDGIRWDVHFANNVNLQITLDDGTDTVAIADPVNGRWQDGKWHTVIGFNDATNKVLYLIVDGELIGTADSTLIGTLTHATDGMVIGARRSTTILNYIKAEISNFALYQDADPNKLFNLIPILSNPQLRESAFNDGGSGTFALLANSNHRLNNDVSAGTGLGQYITTVINTSEGWYDIIELHRTNSNGGIRKLLIDGVEVVPEEDWYSASLTHNLKTENKGIYLSAGSHILKYLSDTKNASSTAYMIRWYTIELIKRDGEATDDEATSGILFGMETVQRSSGTWGNLVSATSAYNQVLNNSTSADADTTEGDIYLKRGKYRVTFSYRKGTNKPMVDCWFGNNQILSKLDTYAGSGQENQKEVREVFVDGGKTLVKIAINGRNPANTTGYSVEIISIRFELIDGKSEGDVVNIWGTDSDFEEVQGRVPITGLTANVSRRFNHYLQIGDTETDDYFWRRYFSGGTYEVKIIYTTAINFGIVDIFTDDNSASPDIFPDLDQYSGSTVHNVESFSVVNIPRGFHDIHIKNKTNNPSSSADVIQFYYFQFTKIGERLDENDNNQDTILNSGHVETDQGTIEVEAL